MKLYQKFSKNVRTSYLMRKDRDTIGGKDRGTAGG